MPNENPKEVLPSEGIKHEKTAAITAVTAAAYIALNSIMGCEPQLNTRAALDGTCYQDTSLSAYIKNTADVNGNSTFNKGLAAAVYPGAFIGAKVHNAIAHCGKK